VLPSGTINAWQIEGFNTLAGFIIEFDVQFKVAAAQDAGGDRIAKINVGKRGVRLHILFCTEHHSAFGRTHFPITDPGSDIEKNSTLEPLCLRHEHFNSGFVVETDRDHFRRGDCKQRQQQQADEKTNEHEHSPYRVLLQQQTLPF
jgi:hypothetical protein